MVEVVGDGGGGGIWWRWWEMVEVVGCSRKCCWLHETSFLHFCLIIMRLSNRAVLGSNKMKAGEKGWKRVKRGEER